MSSSKPEGDSAQPPRVSRQRTRKRSAAHYETGAAKRTRRGRRPFSADRKSARDAPVASDGGAESAPTTSTAPTGSAGQSLTHSYESHGKRRWSKEEDAIVQQWVKENGTSRWTELANSLLHCRLGKQCRERWYNVLDPQINVNEWSLNEVETLFRAQQELGNRWAEIAKRLPGRTSNSVKNQWHLRQRRLQRDGAAAAAAKWAGTGAPPSPAEAAAAAAAAAFSPSSATPTTMTTSTAAAVATDAAYRTSDSHRSLQLDQSATVGAAAGGPALSSVRGTPGKKKAQDHSDDEEYVDRSYQAPRHATSFPYDGRPPSPPPRPRRAARRLSAIIEDEDPADDDDQHQDTGHRHHYSQSLIPNQGEFQQQHQQQPVTPEQSREIAQKYCLPTLATFPTFNSPFVYDASPGSPAVPTMPFVRNQARPSFPSFELWIQENQSAQKNFQHQDKFKKQQLGRPANLDQTLTRRRNAGSALLTLYHVARGMK